MKKTYLIEKQLAESFLYGQIELYKIKFADIGDNKYLKVMNNLNMAIEFIRKSDDVIKKLSKENKKLKDKNVL